MASSAQNHDENGGAVQMFVPVDNPAELEDVLTSRLPLSANVFNAVKMSKKWENKFQFFTYGWENPAEAWIVVKSLRPDLGQEISISRPHKKPIAPEMKEIFKRANFIDWAEPYLFSAVETEISAMILDIGIRDYRIGVSVHPCYLFYLDTDEALKLNPTFKDSEDGAQIVSLSPGQGTEFIMKTWKYASPGSPGFVEECLKLNPSAGVSVDGRIVSGVTFPTNGFIGMLYTLMEGRGKGYARATMHSVMKSLATDGFVPACTVETRNLNSKAFQQKIGFKEGPVVDYIFHKKSSFD